MKWTKATKEDLSAIITKHWRDSDGSPITPSMAYILFNRGENIEWLDESATPGESKELEQLAEKLFPYPVKKNIFAISHLEYEKVNNYICDLVDTYRKTFTEWLDESPESKEPLKELKQNCQDAINYIKDMEDDFQQGCKTAYSVVVDWIEELSTENNKNKQL